MPMQWKGWCKIDSVAVPCNTTGLEKTPGKEFGENVHKHGWVINYAEAQNAYEGTVDFPLLAGIISSLKVWAVTTPDTSKDVVLSPDGTATNTYTYPDSGGKCLVRGLTLAGNMGGVSTASLDLVATGRDNTGSAPTFTATAGATDNTNPIPYWKTALEYDKAGSEFGGASDATQVTAWSVTITRSPVVLYTFDATNDPNTIQAGTLDVTGTVTVYNASGTPIPVDGGTGTLTLGATSWNLNYFVFTGYAQPISGPNAKAVRNLAFRLLGDTTNGPIY